MVFMYLRYAPGWGSEGRRYLSDGCVE